MSKVHSIACGLPFCQSAQGKQTDLSIRLRVTAIAIGTIVAIGGILILRGTPGMSSLGHVAAWIEISVGGTLVLIAASVKYVEYENTDAPLINADAPPTSEDLIPSKPAQRKEELHTADKPTTQVSRSKINTDASLTFEDFIPSKPAQRKEELHTADKPTTQVSRSEIAEEEAILISEETIAKLQSSMAIILEMALGERGGIKFYASKFGHRIFTLDTAPDIIFKMAPNDNPSVRERHQRTLAAIEVCRTYQLGLLVIPRVKLFTVTIKGEKYVIIAEQKLDINPYESAQEQYYEEFADSLDETIRQLAIFICKTGYRDVAWRNNPILNNSFDTNGNRRFALIDLEDIDDPQIGLFGGTGEKTKGLVRCVNERQGLIVEAIAKANGIETTRFHRAYERRKAELEDGKKLQLYYAKAEVVRGDEPVVGDIDSMDFAPYSAEKAAQLRTFASILLAAINAKIARSSPEESIKGRRYISIDFHNDEDFTGMEVKLIIAPGEEGYIRPTDDEFYNVTYLGFVTHKFVQMGLIYKAIRDPYYYYIQA